MSKLTAALTRCAASVAVLAFIVQIPTMAQSPGDAKENLITIQKQWADARVKPDIAYLERLYAKEFRVHTMDGAVASRADDIAMFKEGRIKPDFVRDEDMNVSVYGEVGIVTGIENVGGTYPAGPLKAQKAELSLRFTNVFVHRDGRWQLVLHQGTQIPKNRSQ
jgi:ketosteroid isomerase-like protein